MAVETATSSLISLAAAITDVGMVIFFGDHLWFDTDPANPDLPPNLSMDHTPHLAPNGALAVRVYQDGRPIAIVPAKYLDLMQKAEKISVGYISDAGELNAVEVKMQWLP